MHIYKGTLYTFFVVFFPLNLSFLSRHRHRFDLSYSAIINHYEHDRYFICFDYTCFSLMELVYLRLFKMFQYIIVLSADHH